MLNRFLPAFRPGLLRTPFRAVPAYGNQATRFGHFFSARFKASLAQQANSGQLQLGTFSSARPVLANTKPVVGWWLMGNTALVFGIVILGGLTRLTESGLSMVDWSLLGTRPPQNDTEWQVYFEKYQQFPEYKVLNKGMSLEEFKNIYWYEYSHRMLGRVIGAFVLIPGVYFIARGYVTRSIRNRVLTIASLVGGQGLLGWYMVKSGLDHQLIENNQVPRVSQYRLAAHLSMAFVICILSFTTALSVLRGGSAVAVSKTLQKADLNRFTKATHAVAGLIFTTAVSGAFVAGLDAGLIYNEFPKMGGLWIPSDLLTYKPTWSNFFENPTTVQFDHRMLAMTTYASVCALWLYSRRLALPPKAKFASSVVFGVASGQVALGITTLLWLVPISLASAHQAGSLTLLTVTTWLINILKHIPK